MSVLPHLLLFLLSAGVIWFFAGLLIESVNNVALRFNKSGFTIAFFVLGFLTSINEISVLVNSTLNGAPEISAGNLAGASFVILLLIIPFVAIAGKGIQLKKTLTPINLALALVATALPTLLMLDGSVTKSEGLVCILIYGTLIYFIRKQHTNKSVPEVIQAVEKELVDKRKTTAIDIVKILVGGVFIFLAGHLLVDEAVYFSFLLSIPTSIMGLLLLSLGTNIPELVIAVRSILKKHKDIAFGDYLGSVVTNTLVFGFLPWLNGRFLVEPTEFIYTAVLTVAGFILFYKFARSKNKISRQEGIILVSVYGIFVLVQLVNLIRFATD
jgi:cation:H+ antiporter